MRIALVNTNRIQPPIAPIGLEYLAETLFHAGYKPDLLDLCWEEDWRNGMRRFFGSREYDVVGFTLRNTDDCAFTSRHSFLPEFLDILDCARDMTGAFILVGGVGFSTMPDLILEACSADAGVHGSGEHTMLRLLQCLDLNEEWRRIPGLIFREGDRLHRNPMDPGGGPGLPPMKRRWLDNPRYFNMGGQAGIETKRGCPWKCIYCCEPFAKGSKVIARPARDVAQELQSLIDQDIDHVHTCDSEFNLPLEHAEMICEEIVRRGLGSKLRWYAYCTPSPFTRELAGLMKRAGCTGINFGVDSGDGTMLRRLNRPYGPEDILRAVRWCRDEGIVVMLDLLFGSPGESRESVTRTIELVKESGSERAGVSTGVRVWPGTVLASRVKDSPLRSGLIGSNGPTEPLFFIEPSLGKEIFDLLDRLIGGDERFFFFNPSDAGQNYNYNGNEVLVDAIDRGYRGAYWDILRRLPL